MTPMTVFGPLLPSACTYPRPREMVSTISSLALAARLAISRSGFRISRSAGQLMSPASTGPAVDLDSSTSISETSPCSRHTRRRSAEDDVGDVFAHARHGRELMLDTLDAHGGDRRALERGQQHPAQRVAESVAETAVQRLNLERAERVGDRLVGHAR